MSTSVRRRLEAQGYCGLDDATLREIGPWLRWAPALCALSMLVGVALASPAILWALAATALLGVWLPFHPFDLLYNFGARHLTGTRPLPHHGPQRRFACGIATFWLVATGWLFHSGATTLGYALGIPLILVAGLVSVTDICIPSLIYNALFNPQRTAAGRARNRVTQT